MVFWSDKAKFSLLPYVQNIMNTFVQRDLQIMCLISMNTTSLKQPHSLGILFFSREEDEHDWIKMTL